MDRKQLLERFDNQFQAVNYDPVGENSYPTGPDASGSFVAVHGESAFYHYYPNKGTGAIWLEWDDRTPYPVAEIMPPDPAKARLAKVDESGNVLDFITESNDLLRYTLDSHHGMMPVRIEYYDILEDGSLFLYRFYTVEKYICTGNGAFLPEQATLHDFAHKREDGPIWVDKEETFVMTAYEENVQFAPEEFKFDFPKGTFIRDNIVDVNYVAGETPDVRDSKLLEVVANGTETTSVSSVVESKDVKSASTPKPTVTTSSLETGSGLKWVLLLLAASIFSLVVTTLYQYRKKFGGDT